MVQHEAIMPLLQNIPRWAVIVAASSVGFGISEMSQHFGMAKLPSDGVGVVAAAVMMFHFLRIIDRRAD